MKHLLSFKRVVRLAASGILAIAAASALAQSFPSRPIRWIVVAPAGSSLDVIARSMQDKLNALSGKFRTR